MDAFRFSISWSRLIPSKFVYSLSLFVDFFFLLTLIYTNSLCGEFLITIGGKLKDGVNKEGVQFYKALIDELIANGIYQSIN